MPLSNPKHIILKVWYIIIIIIGVVFLSSHYCIIPSANAYCIKCTVGSISLRSSINNRIIDRYCCTNNIYRNNYLRYRASIRHDDRIFNLINPSNRLVLMMLNDDVSIDSNNDSNIVLNNDVNIDTVSDAEALLACHAYLQRKNLLSEWSTSSSSSSSASLSSLDRKSIITKDGQQSHGTTTNHNNILTNNMDESIGYFWENPTELRYYNTNYRLNRMIGNTVSNETNQQSSENNLINSTTTIIKSIEGTEYNYIEHIVPQVSFTSDEEDEDDDDILLKTASADIVAEVAMSDPLPSLRTPLQDESFSTTLLSDKHVTELPVNDYDNVWDVFEDDVTIPIYRKDYTDSVNTDSSWYDDETHEMKMYQQRSNRTKHRFSNITWKEQWYQRRWSTKYVASKDLRRQQTIERRLQHIISARNSKLVSTSVPNTNRVPVRTEPNTNDSPSTTTINLLHSQLLSRMNDDDIGNAIRTYIVSNEKRSKRRKLTNQLRKQFLLQRHYDIVTQSQSNVTMYQINNTTTETIIYGNNTTIKEPQKFHYHYIVEAEKATNHVMKSFTFISPDIEQQQLEQQRLRSERSKKAYQTRIENQKKMLALSITTNDDSMITKRTSRTTKSLKKLHFQYLPSIANKNESSIMTPNDAFMRIDRLLQFLHVTDYDRIIPNNSTIALLPIVWDNTTILLHLLNDIQILIQPKKLKLNRKSLLLCIIRHIFQERGMCIDCEQTPQLDLINTTSDNTKGVISSINTVNANQTYIMASEVSLSKTNIVEDKNINSIISSSTFSSSSSVPILKFMTKSSITELGSYIIQRIDNRIHYLSSIK